MVQVLLPLKTAISVAKKNSEVKGFVETNQAYLVSTHALIASEDSISKWGLNYFSPTLNQASTFEVTQDIGQEYKIDSQGISEMREKDLQKLDLGEAKPVQDLLNKAMEKKTGTANNIIVTASHPADKKAPILRVNIISAQLFINSIILNMKSGRILSNLTDNITGTNIIAGTVKLGKT